MFGNSSVLGGAGNGCDSVGLRRNKSASILYIITLDLLMIIVICLGRTESI